MFEEVPTELFLVLPAVLGVALLVMFVFWVGSGRQRSFEEDKAKVSRDADKVLREKQKTLEKGKKKRQQPFPRKKAKGEEESEQSLKPILKGTVGKPVTPERIPLKVGFQLDTPPKEVDKSKPRRPTSPPTPHPSAKKFALNDNAVAVDLKLLTSTEEEDPKPKPIPTKQTTTSTGGGGQKKPKQKTKQSTDIDAVEGMPVSKISEIVGASPLSDDDVQELIEQLLEKMTMNAEWQGASMRTESVKSLKKMNQDLQTRCAEAEKTVTAHGNRIRELRSEIMQERGRHQTIENSLNAKINQQANELQVTRTKIDGLQDELKQAKQQSSQHTMQQLQEEYTSLQHQMATIAQENSSLNSQLVVTTKEFQGAEESNTALKNELRRAKEALKTSTNTKPLTEKINELEGLVVSLKTENRSLQSAMQSTNEENTRLVAVAVREERDTLAQNSSDLEYELKEVQEEMEGLRHQLQAKNWDQGRVAGLETEIARLRAEADSLRQNTAKVQQAQVLTAQPSEDAVKTRAEVEARCAEEVARVKTEYESEATLMKSRHDAELQGLRESVLQLEGAKREGEKELGELQTQLQNQKETYLPLEAQLRQLTEQLANEETSKKLLEGELESLRQEMSNGPLPENGVLPSEAAEKQASVSLEVHQEVLKGKEEALTQVQQAKDELSEQVKILEQKLTDVKAKNNTLRDNCWKARDSAAATEKDCEGKLKQAYKVAEERCKAVRAEALAEAQDTQKVLLQRLFPEISVDDNDFSKWLDEFETKAQEEMQNTLTKVSLLEDQVRELQENEHKIIQEAEQFRKTLEATMDILSRLQSNVEGESTEHQSMIREKDRMVEMERQTNRGLQEQLVKERGVSEQLQKQLESIQEKENDQEQVKERLQELQHDYDAALSESETLRHSLHREVELKEEAQQKLQEMTEKQPLLEEKAKAEGPEQASRNNDGVLGEVEVLKDTGVTLDSLKLSNSDLSAKKDKSPPRWY